jgi:hypothetical protein
MSAATPEELLVESNQPRARRKEPTLIIAGADYHPGFQQIAFVDTKPENTESDDWDTLRKPRPYRHLAARG